MQQGHYRCEHKTIGKATHTKGFLFKHANYIARPSAEPEFLSLGDWDADRSHFLSEVSTYQHQAYGVGNQKPTVRANGRLADTFTLSLERRMQPEHRREALALFAAAITDEGRSRIFISIHRNRPDHPHAHVFLIDRDTITGKSVAMLSASERDRKKAGFTEPNATEYVRLLWEQAQNTVFEDYHYDIRVDRRSKDRQMTDAELGLAPQDFEIEAFGEDFSDPSAELPEIVGEDLPSAPECTSTPVVEPESEEDGDLSFSDQEADVAETKLHGADAVAEAMHYHERLTTITNYTDRRDALRARVTSLEDRFRQQKTQAEADFRSMQESRNHMDAAARTYAQEGVGFRGRMKGLRIAAFGLEWKSKGRQHAEHLQAEVEHWTDTTHARALTYKEWETVLPQTEQALRETQAELARTEREIANSMELLGTDAELEQATGHFKRERQRHLNMLNGNDIVDLYDAGEISFAEASACLNLLGDEEAARKFAERNKEVAPGQDWLS